MRYWRDYYIVTSFDVTIVNYVVRLLVTSLECLHNERDGVSNHRRLVCLHNRLFRRRSKKTSKLHVTGLCEGNSPVTGDFSTQRASNAENVSILMTSSWLERQLSVWLPYCRGRYWRQSMPPLTIIQSQWQSVRFNYRNRTVYQDLKSYVDTISWN